MPGLALVLKAHWSPHVIAKTISHKHSQTRRSDLSLFQAVYKTFHQPLNSNIYNSKMAKRSVITFLVAWKLRYDKPCNVLKTTRFSLRSACIGDNLYCAEKVQAYPICVKFLIWLFDAAIVKFYIVRWILQFATCYINTQTLHNLLQKYMNSAVSILEIHSNESHWYIVVTFQ
uniref:Uncharacterized protein n=1 Tax=Glossina palpalis gambiensis TaxID=67801 RepID=A0A1B0BWF9_9MUSC